MAYPSVAELMRKTRLGERTVQGALRDLEKNGELSIDLNGGPRGCNRYQVIMSDPRRSCTPADPAPPQIFTSGGADPAPGGADPAPGTIREPSENHQSGASAPTAQAVLAGFIDWDRANGGALTRRTIGQLAKQIAGLLSEGIDDRYIRLGLTAWRAKEQHPATLDSFVNAAMNGKSGRHRRISTGDRALAEAEELKAQLRDHRELA